MSHRTANAFVRRKVRREFYRYARQRRRWHEKYDSPFVKLGNILLKTAAWLLLSFFVVLIAPPIVKTIVIGFWLILFAFVALLLVRPKIKRHQMQKELPLPVFEPPSVPTKACPGPLAGGKSPCPKEAQIGLPLDRCEYCERLRPHRLK